jgi:hypothetical protein
MINMQLKKHEALESCFVTTSLTPQEEIASVNVLIKELPEMLVSGLEKEGIRGGLSGIMTRYVEANNKYMINYISNKDSSYLQVSTS